eukprot:3282411-Pleurochrysis_carterae.AAC.1
MVGGGRAGGGRGGLAPGVRRRIRAKPIRTRVHPGGRLHPGGPGEVRQRVPTPAGDQGLDA